MDKNQKRKSRAICLDSWEMQIIYGSLLGNAFIVDPPKGLHCYMVIRQSKKHDKNNFLYKTTELKDFGRTSAVYTDKNDYRWTSISHQDFDRIRDFCYKDKKKHITMEWLNILKDTSLMVWFLDRGFYKNGKIGLNIVNLKNCKDVIFQYFNEVHLPCKLINNKIIFDDKDKFLKIIAHRLPSILHYRLFEPTIKEKNEK